jgi:plasmid stabilization system protein ParE
VDHAESDLLAGFRFYEQQSTIAGFYFLNTIYAELRTLSVNGGIHPRKLDHFCKVSRKFPYVIYYSIEGDDLTVLRILDGRRDPDLIFRLLNPPLDFTP